MSVLDEWSPTTPMEASGAEPASLGERESPFLEAPEGLLEGAGGDGGSGRAGLLESPLLSEQSPFVDAGPAGLREAGDRDQAAFRQLLTELYDQQLDEALYELAQGAAAAAEAHAEHEAFGAAPEDAARAYLEAVREPAEAMLEHLAAELERVDVLAMPEAELQVFLDRLEPPAEITEQELEPEAEQFLGGLWSGAKRIAKGAVDVAKKGVAAVGRILPIGVILNKLKALVRPLLARVLQFAMDRLPPDLRPAALRVARALGIAREAEEGEADVALAAEGFPATEAEGIQEEFNANAAALLFAADEAQAEQVVAEAAQAIGASAESAVADLVQARERFVAELAQLPRGGDPGPAMEQFLPAVMAVLPLVKMGIGLIGRRNVVDFLAKLLASRVKDFLGPEQALRLSQAIFDKGLGMIGLEAATPVDPGERLAEQAIAATVEDTVHRLAEQGEHVFDDARLLEAATAEAFQEAAAAHFPDQLVKPDLRETATADGLWRLGPHVPWYRVYTRVLEAQITPQTAGRVSTFGGQTLAAFLRQRYGITGPVRARVRLYEAIPGTTLPKIARMEQGVPGLGARGAQAWMKLHPLTPEAAGLLLGEPGLGRRVAPAYLQTRRRIAAGQRFYYLELPEPRGVHPPQREPGAPAVKPRHQPGGQPARPPAPWRPRPAVTGRLSQVNVVFDLPRGQGRVCIYLSEADAQAVAARLRESRNALGAMVLVRRIYDAALRSLFDPNRAAHLKVIREEELFFAAAARAVGGKVVAYLAQKLLAWVEKAVLEYLQEKGEELVRRADDRADGVTIVVGLQQPAAFTMLRVVLGLQPAAQALPSGLSAQPLAGVRTVAGFYFA